MDAKTFLTQFGHIADAPNGIQKLREMVLQLAVQGKLVPQDPNDAPASELLKLIEKQRPTPNGKDTNIELEPLPYALPTGWEWIRLERIGNIFNGNSINKREKEIKYAGAVGLPYIATKDVGYGYDELDYANGICIPEHSGNFKVAHQGAVLICSEGGSAGKKCGITDRDICFGNKLFANETFGGIPSKFILCCYLSPLFRTFFLDAMTGIIGGVSIGKFTKFPVPLPPLPEQHRIVAKVDELMALCDELAREQERKNKARLAANASALHSLSQSASADDLRAAWHRVGTRFDDLYTTPDTIPALRQTILQLAVQGKLVPQDPNDEPADLLLDKIREEKERLVKEGKLKKQKQLLPIEPENTPFDLPSGWEWARFPELGEFARGKSKHRPRNDPRLFRDGKYPLIQTGAVAQADGLIMTHYSLYNDFGLEQSRLWKSGTLCITIAANIADSAILGIDACFPDSVVGFVPASLFENARYFDFFMKTAKAEIERYAPSTAQKNINLGILEQVLVPVPPLEETGRIVAKVDALMALCDELESKLTTARETSAALAASAVHHLLAG